MKQKMWEKFPELVKAVRQDHKHQHALVGKGHDFAHALMVAQYCLKITKEPITTLAWVAAMCHNTDRIYPNMSEAQIEEKVRQYLLYTTFPDNEKNLVVQAVLTHSQKTGAKDNLVTVTLMDSDKLANLGSLIIIRSSQFRYDIPAIDLRFLDRKPPGISYEEPGSIYWDLKHILEWEQEGWFRIPKAKKLAKPLFKELQNFLDRIIKQYKDVDLLPYPFPDDFGN